MIIIHLIGGLGNQMFQYAIARSLAEKNKTEFKMDLSGYQDQGGGITPRSYALNIFNIQENFATEVEVDKLKKGKTAKISKLLQRFGLAKKQNSFVVEPHFNFASEILEIQGDAYLEGYWQTEKYFQDFADVIRKEFTLKEEFSVEDSEMAKEIKNCNAVSLHIRRGDYVTNSSANKFHGMCSLEYYDRAIKLIGEKIENPVFYIFSDDIAWVKENLHIDFPAVYVSDGKLKDYEELMLMSYCKHNIIANSSFSWWGAWLNANPEKIVIAPKCWFQEKSVDTSDIIPESWIKL